MTEASFKANSMLEILKVIDCPNIRNALDLTNSASLKELDIHGSGFTGITLASNAPVETLILNDPTTLSFLNLSKVSEFDIEGYDKLNGLYLDNIDDSSALSSKTLVEESEDNSGLAYNLQNVKWVIEDSDEIDDATVSIPLLDNLAEKTAVSTAAGHLSIDKNLALSGTLTITAEAYSGTGSLALYQKYTRTDYYPNLDIIFESANSKLYNIEIVDGNDNVQWKSKAQGNYVIDSTLLSSGPLGSFNSVKSKIITKMDTVAKTFTFADSWEIYSTGDTPTKIATIEAENPYYNTVLNQDILIKPIFNENDRSYLITFMNGEEIIHSDSYVYNTLIKNIIPIFR